MVICSTPQKEHKRLYRIDHLGKLYQSIIFYASIVRISLSQTYARSFEAAGPEVPLPGVPSPVFLQGDGSPGYTPPEVAIIGPDIIYRLRDKSAILSMKWTCPSSTHLLLLGTFQAPSAPCLRGFQQFLLQNGKKHAISMLGAVKGWTTRKDLGNIDATMFTLHDCGTTGNFGDLNNKRTQRQYEMLWGTCVFFCPNKRYL